MEDANTILFATDFDGKSLFKNQLDLANQIMSAGIYKVNFEDQEEVNKIQTRLKTYISQILSETAVRNITDEFKQSLESILSKKIRSSQLRDEVLKKILIDLKTKNTSTTKADVKALSFKQDVLGNNYFSIISAKPIAIDKLKDNGEFSLRDFLFQDYIKTFLNNLKPKYFRFNFPLQSYCELFWIGFRKMIVVELMELLDSEIFKNIFVNDKFSLKKETKLQYENYKKHAGQKNYQLINQFIFLLSLDIVELLNKNKIILTFHNTEPIYSTTLIAIMPDTLKETKLYLILEDEEERTQLLKVNSENVLLWRIFVWDKIKTSNGSKNIEFPSSQNINLIQKIQ